MNTIKFNVEDSKVSEVLKSLLNSGVTVKDVEIINTQHSETTMVSKSNVVEPSGSSFTLYQYNYSISQNEGSSSTAVIPDVRFVGGTIFYIDETADGEYQFFDAKGNLIKNVQVGDRPYYYRIIKKGSKDKYYVYYDKIYDNLRWTYYKDKRYVCESLSICYLGKTNTEIVMAKDNGAYITEDSNGYPTIWYKLQQVRNTKVGGCDDWFVPSGREIERLRRVIKKGAVTGGTIAGSSYEESVFSKKEIWSSSESFSQDAWIWHCYGQIWYHYHKSNINSVFFTRSF